MKSGRIDTFRHLLPTCGIVVVAGLALAAVAALTAAALGSDLGFAPLAIEDAIRAWGAWSVGASIALMVLHSFIPFPAEFLAIANGMVFGPWWGTVITWFGAMLGAAMAFALSRWLGRPFIAKVIAQRNWQTLDRWAAEDGVYVVLVSRFIPLIAFNLINYAAGLSRISWWTFLWTTGVGILPLTVLMVAMGHSIDTFGWGSWGLLLIGAVIVWALLRRSLHPRPGTPGRTSS